MEQSENRDLIKLGISTGDINGIGPEIILKALADNRINQMCTPVVYGSLKLFNFHRKQNQTGEFSFNITKSADSVSTKQSNLINVWEEEAKIDIGQSTETGGAKAFESLQKATEELKNKKIEALVTAPINKNNIQRENFKFPGHTEYLAHQFGVTDYLMLLVHENLRVGTVTGHIPVAEVSKSITVDKILSKLKVMHESLIKDFNVRKPVIAVLGLNPHSGDNGLIGNEEKTIILPAIEHAKEKGMMVMGPYAADGFFGSGQYKKFDGILSMYHDQGLIPFKTLAFGHGINFTAGLPVIRTSPDHGVGYDIAGKGIASEESFREAIYLAIDIYKNRKNNAEITSNPLKIMQQRERRANAIE